MNATPKYLSLDQYFAAAVQPCQTCSASAEIAHYMTYKKLPPFLGGPNPTVLIIGHSPKVRTASRISVTLDLNREKAKLYKYITGEILKPLRIPLRICAATNIVKCLTTELPEDIPAPVEFMTRAFARCSAHLLNEVELAQTKLLITLSERVSDLVQSQFSTSLPSRPMKEIFATLRQLDVAGNPIAWIPVVHLPKPKIRAYYFPEQTRRLAALAPETVSLLAS